MKVLLMIPTYNEEAVIGDNVRTCLEYFGKSLAGWDWELLVADNGSTDKTIEIVREIAKDAPRLHGFHTDAAGRGGALKRAIAYNNADVYVYFDADLATDLKHVQEAIDAIDGGAEVVYGSRLAPHSKTNRTLKRTIISRGFNVLIKTILGGKLSDYQCGFKAMNQDIAKSIGLEIEDNHWGWDTELLIRAERGSLDIAEIPVVWEEMSNDERESKVKIVRTIFYFLDHIWKLRKKLDAETVKHQTV